LAAHSAGTAPLAKAKPKPKVIVPLSVDITDLEVFRRRWEQAIMKDCSTADAIDMKMSAEDRSALGINVGSSV
jgi:hypothetical protein